MSKFSKVTEYKVICENKLYFYIPAVYKQKLKNTVSNNIKNMKYVGINL